VNPHELDDLASRSVFVWTCSDGADVRLRCWLRARLDRGSASQQVELRDGLRPRLRFPMIVLTGIVTLLLFVYLLAALLRPEWF
jgi:K+-transporting ATPase KdpF subunit